MTAKLPSYGPQYYNRGKVEVWDFIRDQDLGYHLGNAVKYICRTGHKGDPVEDLKKAIHYLENELLHVKCKNLSGHDSPDTIVFSGSRVPGGLSDQILDHSTSEGSSEGSYSGGVQGISGSGRDVISF